EDTQIGEQNPNENIPPAEGTPAEGETWENPEGNIPESPEGVIPEIPAETVPESTPPLSQENVQVLPQEGMPGIGEFEEDLEFEEYITEAQNALGEIAEQDPLMALIYLCDYYGLKREPDISSEDLVWLPSGTTVLINGVALDPDYTIWYRVTVEHNGDSYTGYVDRNYLAYSNEIFTAWENNYFARIAMYAADMGGYPDIEQFPASYRDKLVLLKQAHPNWTFVRQNTGLDWEKVVNSENSKGRSLINSVMGAAYRNGYHSPGWYYASEAAVKYYLDPRNFLDETRIFQFEQLTYNSSYHSKAAVQNILSNTFMRGELPGAGMTYADAFFQVGVSLKVSPFHLACRVFQEQGEGKSALISGTYDAVPAYRGYYNYFNIGASGTTTKQVIESGLAKAVKEGWNSPYASIKGGSAILSKSYILRGQDTLYLQKFDVDASDGTLYTHQYMQNIMAPYTESQMVKTAYSKINALDNSFVFKIPVYENMPPSACPVPTQVTPTAKPTATPTAKPTVTPTAKPTPTATPTVKPTSTPGASATGKPSASAKPTATPTVKPTDVPIGEPTNKPIASPTDEPTAKPADRPTSEPTATPIAKPTSEPTASPTAKPTSKPTAKPTAEPTAAPTAEPTAPPTAKPTTPPTAAPTA
ncbi:MAG: PT domain-containing protein, partial [Lachnospiraceae bacterium]|nr:PT domain-containing protein [Lachnospiraceae bacterium]